jgi:sensor c-di-GMP phosphodiesterase-like protein
MKKRAMSASRPNPLRDLVTPPLATSLDAGIDKVLHAVREHLGMDVAFLTEFRERNRIFRHVDAKQAAPVKVGDTLSLTQGYCQRVVDGRLAQLIKNAAAHPEAAALPETDAIPIGSLLSVPIRLSDDSLTERDLQVMRVLAKLLADQIDHEVSAVRLRAKRVDELLALMRRGEPSIVYQPIYDLESNRIAGVEALARFRSNPPVTPDVWFD